MSALYYIGLDIHKKMIAYCIKTLDGRLIDQGKVNADRKSLHEWVKVARALDRGHGGDHLHRLDL